jgi:hypothetical protein
VTALTNQKNFGLSHNVFTINEEMFCVCAGQARNVLQDLSEEK